ncbi:MAG: hypothetical protein GIKADHBN_01048 [Phycisphaerales bacterium]|nr:hypothetical protein [Phycisphaerales bacterium]
MNTELTRLPFADAAAEKLRDVQAAMTDLLAQAGVGGARATDVGRRLGLDKTLAWKVARFAQESDPVAAARHMPGSGGVEVVLRAASAHGIATRHIEAVREADQRLREFVDLHAGDRRSFETMLAGGVPDDRLVMEEGRAYFRAGAAIWGVRARAQFLMLALRPSEKDEGMLDAVQLGGLVDFERLRPRVPWIFRRLRASVTDNVQATVRMRREPLDPTGPPGSSLVREYCSDPLPEVRQFEGTNGWLYHELAPGPVGRGGALTCVTGEIYRSAVPFLHSPQNTTGRYTLIVRTPVECVLFDLLLHRSLTHFGRATASVAGLLEDRPPDAGAAAPLAEPHPAQRLGAPPVLQTPRLASYPTMIAGAFARAGWGTIDDFVGYRMELKYPAAPCELAMTCSIGTSG